MNDPLPTLLTLAGVGHFGVLIASALVPSRLRWRETFAVLPRLHRQMAWTYAAYVVLAIVAFGLLSIWQGRALAAGGGLARGVCAYVAIFWGGRLALQAVFDVREHLTAWWLRLGYHALSALFLGFTLLYGWAALRPAPAADSLTNSGRSSQNASATPAR